MNKKNVSKLVKELLIEIGEDPEREGLAATPERVAESLSFLTSGYKKNHEEVINNAIYELHINNMILIKDIEIYSLCEHHVLPFYGKCHIGYIPQKKILGVSKLARVVEIYSRRLQIQERLTEEIANTIDSSINPYGVGVVMECKHLCMMMRGVEKQNSTMVTSTVLGNFHDDPSTRMEFINLIKGI